MNNPCQGVFVKNPDYTGEEEYDFYFVDRLNFCVRKVTLRYRIDLCGDEERQLP